MRKTLKIATRKSALALWQANHVSAELLKVFPDLNIEIVGIVTQGDKIQDMPLSKVGGKGLFLKELENALLDGTADIAVHSLKDVPALMPEGLCLPVILPRVNPLDAFISLSYENWKALPNGATVGTSSLRRVSQLKRLRPDLNIVSLRGNVDTRLGKLKSGQFDAIILAAAGLERLNLGHEIKSLFSIDEMLPAVGQGAIGIECRIDDKISQSYIQTLHSEHTQCCVLAERSMNAQLGGGCSVPVAGYAIKLEDSQHIELKGLVSSLDGKKVVEAQATGLASSAAQLGEQVASELIAKGALDIIQAINLDNV